MEQVLIVINYIIEHYETVITGVVAILTGLIAIFSLIPGEQPEKTLRAMVDFLSKFSKK